MTSLRPRLALALAGGAARGIAHIGVLDVLERERIHVDFIAGSSMGALIGALSATGLHAAAIARIADGFRFPRRFIPGGLLDWNQIFPTAAPVLRGWRFEQLSTELAVTAVDLERGRQVILHEGAVLAAVRASCAVPGVMPPEKIGGCWLVDGGLVNILPVDVACAADVDVVLAVKPKAGERHRMPYLDSHATSLLARVGRYVPNPATAKLSFEVLVRAAEIALETSATLASSMTGPELLIEPDVDDIGMRDFQRVGEAIEAGRRAAEAIVPELRARLALPPRARGERDGRLATVLFDPVCGMAIGAARALASSRFGDATYYFCSTNCQERFAAAPLRYLQHARDERRASPVSSS